MVAFRKLFPVLAVIALLLGASSAFAQATIQCNVTAGVPPIVRSEGLTELVGDILISCTGGTAVTPFLANFQVFLNTNVTSRLVGNSLSEAMLLIDDPGTGTVVPNPFCLSPGPTSNPAGLPGGALPAPSCPGAGALTPGGPQTGTYNAFLAERAVDIAGGSRENSLVWANIPVIPPATTIGGVVAPAGATRQFRITNIRANATGIGPGGLGLPGQIVAFVSVNPPGTLPLNNPQQIVGYVQPGLIFDLRNPGNSDSAGINVNQCTAASTAQSDLFGNPASNSALSAQASFRFREGFQNAFKPRVVANQAAALGGGAVAPYTTIFNSESGLIRTGPSGSTATPGLADTGTRLAVRFSNIPANVRIFVANTNSAAAGSNQLGRALLVQTDVNGAGGSTPTTLSGGTIATATIPSASGAGGVGYVGPTITGGATTPLVAAEIPVVNGTGLAVWEVIDNGNNQTLAGVNEELVFPFGYAYRTAAGATQIGFGTGTVTGGFAPFYATGGTTMSSVNPIPRFVASSTPTNVIRVQPCQTNLLFPYVTNWAGFDTGLAIANTSSDPFSDPQNRQQEGRCRINYYGTLPNGNAPSTLREETDRAVRTGETITMVLSSGGGLGLRGNANFQGYIIAQCDFQFAHGFAFITDGPIGQARVAEGYLALVLDGPDSLRGQTNGEVRGH